MLAGSRILESEMPVLLVALTILLFSASAAADERSARELCAETVLNYAHYSDTGQREKFGELFTREGVLLTGGAPRKPNQVITEADRAPRTSRHVTTNHIVREENGELTGTSYFTLYYNAETSDAPLPMNGQPVAVGVYHDKYAIEDGVCKFTERVAKATFAGRE
jgi:hypothetical protein